MISTVRERESTHCTTLWFVLQPYTATPCMYNFTYKLFEHQHNQYKTVCSDQTRELTFPLGLLLVHDTMIHSLSLPWYLSTVLTSTRQLFPRPLDIRLPSSLLLPAWSCDPSTSLALSLLVRFKCSPCWCCRLSWMMFCCWRSGVMTPISPGSRPHCGQLVH